MSALYQRCKRVVESCSDSNSTLLNVNDCRMVMDLHDQRQSQQEKIIELGEQIEFKIKECQELAQACNRYKNLHKSRNTYEQH